MLISPVLLSVFHLNKEIPKNPCFIDAIYQFRALSVSNVCCSGSYTKGACAASKQSGGGGRTRLPKFKFSAKFPVGLHVILQIQIRKFENDCYIM